MKRPGFARSQVSSSAKSAGASARASRAVSIAHMYWSPDHGISSLFVGYPKSNRLGPDAGFAGSKWTYCELGSRSANEPKFSDCDDRVKKFSPLIQTASAEPSPGPRPAAVSARMRSTRSRVFVRRVVSSVMPSAASSGFTTVSIQVFRVSLPPQWAQTTRPSWRARSRTWSHESSPARKELRKASASGVP